MKVDCYNACECCFSDLEYGDAFYTDGHLYIKIFDRNWKDPDNGLAVKLDTGYLTEFDFCETVTKADAKVVAVNPIE